MPLAIEHEFGEDRYAYDRFGRLIARERHAPGATPEHVEYFLHDALGDRLAARRRDGSDWRAPDGQPDASGRPTRLGALALRYGAQGRLVEARGEKGATRHAYDAFGVRAARSGPSGERGFLHHAGALVAETDADGRLARQYLRWHGRLVAVLDHARASDGQRAATDSLARIHADHLGTPIAATDESGRVVWRGDLDAFGRLARERGGFEQPLRLEGQYFDPDTGLHDNVLRTYDPDAGRYLEPDPLRLAAGLNPFAYVDGNPLVATDPLGLILFAFDGTGNGATGQNGEDVSNVRKFFEQYDDPHKWYMAGVGRDDAGSGIEGGALDFIDAGSARARVDWMLGTLDGFLGDAWIGKSVPVDVIGFSRGAAMARDFVNRVATLIDNRHYWARGICVDLRFLGLWDTVAQFGVLGASNERWQLGIPSAVRATFHAVALNERRALFPLESALGGSAFVVERGFVGDHSDVGGGNAEGDLSDVSLARMTQMARSMGGSRERAAAGRPLRHRSENPRPQLQRHGRSPRPPARCERPHDRTHHPAPGRDRRREPARHGGLPGAVCAPRHRRARPAVDRRHGGHARLRRLAEGLVRLGDRILSAGPAKACSFSPLRDRRRSSARPHRRAAAGLRCAPVRRAR
ncbi:MAG: DUF2235 domain-containing protein [Burkholderiaceae bacterium]|nr:DUF2235 domain-containing protein [Burkholderiaceae bacterium]